MLAHLHNLYNPNIHRYLINIAWHISCPAFIQWFKNDSPWIPFCFHINSKLSFTLTI